MHSKLSQKSARLETFKQSQQLLNVIAYGNFVLAMTAAVKECISCDMQFWFDFADLLMWYDNDSTTGMYSN